MTSGLFAGYSLWRYLCGRCAANPFSSLLLPIQQTCLSLHPVLTFMSASPVIGLQRCVRSTESPFGMKPDSSAPPLPLPWRPRAVGQLHLSWRSWLSSSQPPPAWPRQPAVGFWVKGGGRRGGPTARRQGSTWSWCVVQDLVALCQRVVAWSQRGHGTGPDSSHLLRQNMRIHSGASLSPFPFLLPKNG